MVVFTCNNCGESLQKPKVEKHYATVCATTKNLTCVDCLKDFREEAYVAHTKCITEQERYSAKGTVTNVIGKGEAKQQQWTDMINELIENSKSATGSQKVIFQIMSNQTENVPRKKMKFLNFIKNAGGNRIMYGDIEKVWDLIEQHKSERVASTEGPSATTDKVSKLSENDDANNEDIEIPVNAENAEPTKKKKKKCKSKHTESDVISDQIESQEKSSDGKKTKKRKSSVHENANIATDVTNGHDSPQLNGNEEKKSKKRKSSNVQEGDNEPIVSNLNGTNTEKKKRKSKGGLLDNNMTETNSMNQDNVLKIEAPQENSSPNDSISKEKKKKKKKLQDDHEVEMKKTKLDDTSATGIVPEVAEANKSISKEKKKKRKSETSQEVTKVPTVEDTPISAADVKVNGNDSNARDDLGRIILKALQKKNTVSLVKLQKKVIGEYCKETNVTESPNLIKKFNKQLKKMKGVEILDNNVTLKALHEC
ncbi:hypothetical protein RI129_008916 [Pyrocoelia pectoralis]|uniref:Cell growth-regulating nucleolar protein n=1 Tax=Pyrocoelia pectoralis TaxID=417401 RepID=A0AAN7VF10_9COLE